MNKYKVVLFDLDGTLLDTSKGIFNSVRFAEKQLGLQPVENETLKNFIGPPPIQSYMCNHGVSREIAEKATTFHRMYGAKYGIYEADVYTGIRELLENLKSKGVKVGVCTLKRQDIAENVLKNFKLSQLCDCIVGIDKQESLTKKDTIEIALKNMKCTNKEQVVLVGDSLYDQQGAQLAKIDFIGVLYGFGLDTDTKYNFQTIETVNDLSQSLL